MIKKYERFFYGQLDLEYTELIEEFTTLLKKKVYKPQYEKISEVVRSIDTLNFETKDKVLINTIMITQLARYYWMMGNFEVGTKGYEKQYEDMLTVCRSIYGFESRDDDLEFYFKKFTKNKMLEEFYFPKTAFWYHGCAEPWGLLYAQDVKSMEKNGYAHSELFSVDYAMMKYLTPRIRGFIERYEGGKFCIQMDEKYLQDCKDMLRFVKEYSEVGTSCYFDEQFGLILKNGRVDQKKLDKLWAKFGKVLSGMWW